MSLRQFIAGATFAIACLLLCVERSPAGQLAGGSFYVESGGIVAGEGENFHDRAAGIKEWKIVPGEVVPADDADPVSNATGGEYVQILPEDGGDAGGPNVPPTIEYRMNIATTGTYRLYTRWDGNIGNAGGSDSMFTDIVELKDGGGGTIADHYELQHGVDGDFATVAWDGDGGFEQNTATPANNPVIWDITTPGIYTLRYSEREDGAALDKWVFQLDNLAAPTGTGPAVSAVVPEPGAIALAVIGLLGLGGFCWSQRRRLSK